MNTLLALILVANVAILALIALFLVKLRAVYRGVVEFITPEAEGKPSPLANTAGVVADMVGRSMIAQAKAVFMGRQSGDNRGEATVTADILEDVVAQRSPAIAALLGSFPTLKKTLRRNPALLDLALSKLAGGLGSGPGHQDNQAQPSGNGQSRLPFNI